MNIAPFSPAWVKLNIPRTTNPKWLMDELLLRLKDQGDVKGPGKRVCRGRIFSPRDYAIDVEEWCFSEAVGNLEEQYGSD